MDIDAEAVRAIGAQCDAIEAEVRAMHTLYDEHAGLQDRLIGTGRVSPALAAHLGLSGLAGRASGQALDQGCPYPALPSDALERIGRAACRERRCRKR